MITCIEYRRNLLSGARENEEMREHRRTCNRCAAHLARHRVFEADLRRVLEVPVPRGLGDRLIERLRPDARSVVPILARPGRRLAIAAAAALIASGGAAFHLSRAANDQLALKCIDFVMKEEAKSIMMGGIARDDAKQALASTVTIERLETIGAVRHVAPCPFNGQVAYHVVLFVPQDKVTLLVMPEVRLSSRRTALHEDMHATVVQIGNGAVGVVAATKPLVVAVSQALLGAA